LSAAARRALALVAFLFVSASPLEAQVDDSFAGKRFRVILNGAFAAAPLEYTESRQFREFAETGTLEASYKEDPGAGLDLGVQYNVMSHLGVSASFSVAKRNGGVSYSAGLPHPLYLNRARQASGDADGFEYQENAGHLDLVARASFGAFEGSAFAGVTRFSVKTDLVDSVQYSHSYPYDSVTITAVPKKTFSNSPTGFNVGGRLDYGLGRNKHFGVGVQLRFSRARVVLAPTEGNGVAFDAGGLQLAAGARLFF
jgi:opacity protein-like surface antigen